MYPLKHMPEARSTPYFLFLLILFFSFPSTAQITVADSTWLSVYNTGKRYQLKNAPFGEKKPKKEVIYDMVFATDNIEVKNKNISDVNAKPLTLAEIKLKVKALEPNLAAAKVLTAKEIEDEKSNKGKRTCEISNNGLKGKVVLIDFDQGCDPTYKCLQAQRAGAIMAVVIHDSDKKDSIALIKGRYADSLRIPCFSITRSQGDSVRMMLPSRTGLFTPKVQIAALQSQVLEFNAVKVEQRAVLQWKNNTQVENESFVIEKSADGKTFAFFKEVAGKGAFNSLKTYNLDDDQPFEDDNYYRLVLKHQDGTTITTEPKLLKFAVLKDFDFYPNPAFDKLNIHLKQFENKAIDLVLYDALGKPIYKEHLENVTNTMKILDLTKLQLAEGYYTIAVINKGRAYTKRFMRLH